MRRESSVEVGEAGVGIRSLVALGSELDVAELVELMLDEEREKEKQEEEKEEGSRDAVDLGVAYCWR